MGNYRGFGSSQTHSVGWGNAFPVVSHDSPVRDDLPDERRGAGSATRLEAAVARAIADGKREVASLNAVVSKALSGLQAIAASIEERQQIDLVCARCDATNRRRLDESTPPSCGTCGHPIHVNVASFAGAAKILPEVDSLLRSSRDGIDSLMRRQTKELSTFNLVLFGRTGAGKSSTIEAFMRGDGSAISDGRSDFTTTVDPREWRGCRVIDTPGINGWGRTKPRHELEEEARRAAEVADIVLLVFDTQNQQQAEFERVAEWIKALEKPVIALLSVRNPAWRFPSHPAAGSVAGRIQISRSVGEHATNIRDELARIGLPRTPIVAMSPRRAFFARGTEPYRGPDKDRAAFLDQRGRFGTESLERWSNLTALEALLAAALEADAVGLRIGMLREEVRCVLTAAKVEIARIRAELVEAATSLEALFDSALRIVGLPRHRSQRAAWTSAADGSDLVEQLEHLRGAAFDVPEDAELSEYAEHLLTARLAPERTGALRRAHETILSAFDRGETLTASEFERRVMYRAKIERVAQDVLVEAGRFASRKLHLEAESAAADLRCILTKTGGIAGRTGSRWRTASTALKTGGLLAGIASVVAPIAIGNIWNPAGWVLGAIGIGIGIGSVIFGWFGRKARERAEQQRLRARQQALANAQCAVHETFDHTQGQIRDRIRALAQEMAGIALSGVVSVAVLCRQLAAELDVLERRIARCAAAIPRSKSPIEILQKACSSVESARLPADPEASRKIWLGQDWVTALDGLHTTDIDIKDHAAAVNRGSAADDPGLEERFFAALRNAGRCASGADADAWLKRARQRLANDPEGLMCLGELEAFRTAPPVICLVGDYSTGKSSLCRRLFCELDLSVPDGLDVRAAPTTTTARTYPLGPFVLMDTPGFQSGREAHTKEALRAVPEASSILYLLQPNIVSGDWRGIDDVLCGDLDRGMAPKLGRAVFIINRADELGVDPIEAPEEFRRLCAAKVTELVQALASRGARIPSERVFVMASDPYGGHSSNEPIGREDFVSFEAWDGLRSFASAMRSLQNDPASVREGVVLDVGVARIHRLAVAARSRRDAIAEECTQFRRVASLLCDGSVEFERLSEKIARDLQGLIEGHAYGVMEEALSAVTDEQIRAYAIQLDAWWDDPTFRSEVERWQKRCTRDIDALVARIEDRLRRRIGSREFRRAFPDLDESGLGIRSLLVHAEPTSKKVASAASKTGTILKGTSKEAVKKVARWVGYRFAPWGATKLTRFLRASGNVLAGIGIALDVSAWLREVRAETDREASRQRAVQYVRRSGAEIAAKLLDGTPNAMAAGPQAPDGAEIGPRSYLALRKAALDEECANIDAEVRRRLADESVYAEATTRYESVLADAHQVLESGRKLG